MNLYTYTAENTKEIEEIATLAYTGESAVIEAARLWTSFLGERPTAKDALAAYAARFKSAKEDWIRVRTNLICAGDDSVEAIKKAEVAAARAFYRFANVIEKPTARGRVAKPATSKVESATESVTESVTESAAKDAALTLRGARATVKAAMDALFKTTPNEDTVAKEKRELIGLGMVRGWATILDLAYAVERDYRTAERERAEQVERDAEQAKLDAMERVIAERIEQEVAARLAAMRPAKKKRAS